MKEKYIDVKRIEFVVTNRCTGKCKHCSAAGQLSQEGAVDAAAAASAVKQIASRYEVTSVMTFGGEPLLKPEAVFSIHAAARDAGIAARQIITNGFFTNNEDKINEVAKRLCECGVNDVLLSADAFHQEHIPLKPVLFFAESLIKGGIPRLRVHPAWLVNSSHENPYNLETKELLAEFEDIGIEISGGNVIFPVGNAAKHLAEYFSPEEIANPVSPYDANPADVRSIFINPNGDVVACSSIIGNIYTGDVLAIIDSYSI